MPVYAYICPECGDKQEIFRGLSDYAKETRCVCGAIMNKDFSKSVPAYHDVAFDSVEHDMPGGAFVYHTRGQLKAEAKRRGLEIDFGPHGSRVKHI